MLLHLLRSNPTTILHLTLHPPLSWPHQNFSLASVTFFPSLISPFYFHKVHWIKVFVLDFNHLGHNFLEFFCVLRAHCLIFFWRLPLWELHQIVQDSLAGPLQIMTGRLRFHLKLFLFSSTLRERENFWQCWRFDLSHLHCAILRSQKLIHSPETPSDCGIEMILDGVVSTARQFFSNQSPFVTKPFLFLKHDLLLQSTPILFVDLGVEVVMPSLTTLFTCFFLIAMVV